MCVCQSRTKATRLNEATVDTDKFILSGSSGVYSDAHVIAVTAVYRVEMFLYMTFSLKAHVGRGLPYRIDISYNRQIRWIKVMTHTIILDVGND